MCGDTHPTQFSLRKGDAKRTPLQTVCIPSTMMDTFLMDTFLWHRSTVKTPLYNLGRTSKTAPFFFFLISWILSNVTATLFQHKSSTKSYMVAKSKKYFLLDYKFIISILFINVFLCCLACKTGALQVLC